MLRFRWLGPLEVRAGEEWLKIGAPKWRSLLAALLINSGQVVSTETLTNEIWSESGPPAKAANLVSIYVLRLRRMIGDSDGSILVTRSPGYQLRVAPEQIDAYLFESMVREGRQVLGANEPERAAGQLAEALALWRGSGFADVPRTPLVEAEAERLAELRLDASELRIRAELACGGHDQVVPDLRRLLADHPLREGLWVLLLRALNGSGRHAEALDAYQRARETIADQLGVDPGPELRRIYADLLAEDAAIEPGPPPGPAGSILAGTVTPSSIPSPPGAPSPSPSATGAPGPGPVPAAPVLPSEGAHDGAATPISGVQADGGPAGLGLEVPADGGAAEDDVATEPASRSAPQFPAQLPMDIADFTGREDQVNHLSQVLAAPADGDSGAVRIAIVAGYGGLGKTSLAVHAAHRVRNQFPDGQLYVDLLGATDNPLPPADVLARFLRDLGVSGREVPVDEAERAARYRTTLAGRRVLVLLDNARDAAQVRPLLPGSGSCAVLVTTRNRMPDLARTKLVDLDVLDDDEALSLFTKIVDDERPVREPEATADLLLACAGLPLAIRICAARLVTRSGWRIRTMANRLRDERRRLDELTVGDLAVRASFEVSFASLPARRTRGVAPADAFRLLGLWQGPTISTTAAAALFGAAEDDAADALELLVDAHLLESKGPDRYKFHDLLRVYASERAVADLSETDRHAAIARLLTWYVRTADAAATAVSPHRYNIPLAAVSAGELVPLGFTGPDEVFTWYDRDRANVAAAIRQAFAAGQHDISWRLTAPMWVILITHANWADCIALHRLALDSARLAANRQGEAWVLNNLGVTLGMSADAEGVGYLEQSLSIRREIGDRMGEAQSVANLADLYQRLGRAAEGLEMLYRAQDLNREVGNRYGEAVAQVNIGDALLSLARYDEAITWLMRAQAAFTELKDAEGIGYALHNLGRCHFSLGQDEQACASFQEALSSYQASGNRHLQASTLRFLGRALARVGRISEARECLVQSAGIYDELGDTVRAAEVRAERIESPA